MAITEAPMNVQYDRLVPALKTLLRDDVLDVIGRAVAFIQRLRQVRACLFVWSVVLSRFGSGRPGFEQARQWFRRLGGAELWPRPFQIRFKSPGAVCLFERAFESCVERWRRRKRHSHPLARAFPDIVAVDSTVIQLADALRPVFKGAQSMASSLKVLLAVSVFGSLPLYARIVRGCQHDMTLFPPHSLFAAGTLILFDKGFVAFERLRDIQQAGLLYLCPMRVNGNAMVVHARRAPKVVVQRVRRASKIVRHQSRRCPGTIMLRDLIPAGKRITSSWDLDVVMWPGSNQFPTHARLVILPGIHGKARPYLTNLDPLKWSPAAIGELYRMRWQIELVFKELKQCLNLENLPSKDPCAVQVFAWASLIALALSRCVSLWLCPLTKLVGLTARLRPALTSRALRQLVRSLARILTSPTGQALLHIRAFTEDILLEIRARNTDRDDSFKRMIPLLAA
jgi:hypothetical protein